MATRGGSLSEMTGGSEGKEQKTRWVHNGNYVKQKLTFDNKLRKTIINSKVWPSIF